MIKKILIGLAIVIVIAVVLYIKNCLCPNAPFAKNCYCSDHYVTESYR